MTSPARVVGRSSSAVSLPLPHANVCLRHDQEPMKIIDVVLENGVYSAHLEREVGAFDAQIDDTSVRQSVAERQFAEIPVVGDEDATFVAGDTENLPVGQVGGVLPPDPGHVEAERAQVERDAGVRARIDEEPRAQAALGLGRTG